MPVALLERALAYTGGVLGGVGEDHLTRPTPCERWDLRALLAHMDDALDAFTEAAAGHVHVETVGGPTGGSASAVVDRLRAKACALLGAWAAAAQGPDPGGPAAEPATVAVGDQPMGSDVLVHLAALEIAVHGWDVARATGGPPLPPALARDLLPAARLLVPAGDRTGRFAAPRAAAAGDVALLLGWLGRDPGWPTQAPARRSA